MLNFLGGLFGGVMPRYSEGIRVGVLVNAVRRGLIWKSWEFQIKVADFNLSVGNTSKGNLWECSCLDPLVGTKMMKMVGSSIRVSYNQYWIKPFQQEHNYTVVSVCRMPNSRVQ